MKRSIRMGSGRHDQLGLTLVELMVAMVIGVVLTAGLVTLVGAMKRTNGTQTGLSQLQDNERVAMTIMTDVLQIAGYFPGANLTYGSNEFLPITVGTAAFGTAGQVITGTTGSSASVPDSVAARYETQAGDGAINCTGGSYAGAGKAIYISQFTVSGNTLNCVLTQTDTAGNVVSTTTTPLITGVTNLKVAYGLKTNIGNTFTSADSYLTATQVNGLDQLTAGWPFIMSISIQLTFTNPLATTSTGAAVPGQPATITFTRVINAKYDVGLRS